MTAKTCDFIDLDFKNAWSLYLYLDRKGVSCNFDAVVDGVVVERLDLNGDCRVTYDDTPNKTVAKTVERFLKMREKGLKYCPFCDGIAELVHARESEGNVSYKTARVRCIECGCATKSVIVDGYYGAETTEQDVIDAWNRRVLLID